MVPGMVLLDGLTVAAAVLLHDTVYALVASLSLGAPFVRPFFLEIVPSALYSGLVAIPLIRIAAWSGMIRHDD